MVQESQTYKLQVYRSLGQVVLVMLIIYAVIAVVETFRSSLLPSWKLYWLPVVLTETWNLVMLWCFCLIVALPSGPLWYPLQRC
jgi:hypothetical protein